MCNGALQELNTAPSLVHRCASSYDPSVSTNKTGHVFFSWFHITSSGPALLIQNHFLCSAPKAKILCMVFIPTVQLCLGGTNQSYLTNHNNFSKIGGLSAVLCFFGWLFSKCTCPEAFQWVCTAPFFNNTNNLLYCDLDD